MSRPIDRRGILLAALLLCGGCSQSGGAAGPGGAGSSASGGPGGSSAGSGGASGGRGGSTGGGGNGGSTAGTGGSSAGRGGSAGGSGGTAGGSGGSAGGSGGTTPVAFNPPTCGKALAGFSGALCGPSGAPCRKLVDENVDATSEALAIATDAQGHPHVLYETAVDPNPRGYYAVRGSGGWATPELLPMPVAKRERRGGRRRLSGRAHPERRRPTGDLALEARRLRVAKARRRGPPRVRVLRHRQLGGDPGRLPSRRAVGDRTGESSLASDPGYGLWNGHWNLTSFGYSQQGRVAPGVALAADGTAHVAIWKYAVTFDGVVDWAARGRSLEPARQRGRRGVGDHARLHHRRGRAERSGACAVRLLPGGLRFDSELPLPIEPRPQLGGPRPVPGAT